MKRSVSLATQKIAVVKNGTNRKGDVGLCLSVRVGDACGVMVIVVENGQDDTSSNTGRD